MPAGLGSRKSSIRGPNGGCVCAEESADFLQCCGQLTGVTVAKVFGEDQKVAALLDGSFSNVHESCLVRFPTAPETFGDVSRDGYRRSAHLWTTRLRDLANGRRVEWSDTWTEADIEDARRASLSGSDERELEG